MYSCIFAAGMSQGTPDTCKTPPLAIPAPFPNIALNVTVVPGYMTIMITGLPELNLLSMHALTSGDEGGAMGGVVSQIIVGPCRATMGSQAVFIAGIPVWRQFDPTLHNLANVPGVTMTSGQSVKQVMR